MDKLRYVKIDGIHVPPGTPIVYEDAEVGCVISNNDAGYAECAVNSDIVNQLIKGNKASFSLEVTRK